MTNMKKKSGKNTYKKGVRLLAAAALTAAMLGSQTAGVLAQADSAEETMVSVLPDNITIEEPMALSEISLPENQYGTLSWADSSQVPSERVQSYEVKLTPFEGVDLSGYEGWDGENSVLRGYVTVVVSSISEETAEPAAPSETPEISVTPDVSVTPGVTEVPEISLTPAPGEVGETLPDITEEDPAETEEAEETLEPAEIGKEETVPEAAPAVTQPPVEDIFEQTDESIAEDERPVTVEENLTEQEMLARGVENHSCSGISVSGISLPWYVQFRVSSGEGHYFTNQADASIFKSYEFELWDLTTDSEYVIPDGEYISVTVPVKEGYEYTIEHLLDNGAVETIIPSVEGDTMIFSTHSFSPFGIAGSKPVVGSDIAEGVYGDNDGQNTSQVPMSPAASNNTATAAGTDQVTAPQNTQAASETASPQTASSGTQNSRAVKTSDDTNILPFVIMAVAAVALIAGAAGIIVLKKKK